MILIRGAAALANIFWAAALLYDALSFLVRRCLNILRLQNIQKSDTISLLMMCTQFSGHRYLN